MSDTVADYILDRHRLRRKLTFWRVICVVAVIGLIGLAAWSMSGDKTATGEKHVARLALSGLLTGDRETLKLIEGIAKSNAAGVIVTIESPGGTTTGAEKIYAELRRLAAKKPVVAVIETTGFIVSVSVEVSVPPLPSLSVYVTTGIKPV